MTREEEKRRNFVASLYLALIAIVALVLWVLYPLEWK